MSDPSGIVTTVLYNPRQLNRETLKAVFTARQALLQRLIEDLQADRPTHHLIVGQRGMGKTSLLRRVGLAIEDTESLSKRLVPLTFPEEQYNVDSLGAFYLNCLDAFADYLEKQGHILEARQVDKIIHETRQTPDDVTLAEAAEAALVQFAKSRNQQFVLLVDNFSILMDRLKDTEKWRLRDWLSRSEQRPVLIAATVKFISDTATYGQALYEFLNVHELTGCTLEESRDMLLGLARIFHAPQVDRWLQADPARLPILNRLAGGAPRTIAMLFQLLLQGMDAPVFQELDRLLDLATPLYKARFEDLPEQAQRVVDALALHWDPATRQDLEQLTRVEGNAISSQLSRLARMGFVEEVAMPGSSKAAYQIAERFFNIWYLMRASRRSRHQVRWLVEFLRACYNREDLNTLARKLLLAQGSEPVSHGRQLLAMSQVVKDLLLQTELKNSALLAFAQVERKRRADIDLSDVDVNWLAKLDRLSVVAEKERFILDGIAQTPSAAKYAELAFLYDFESRQFLKAEAACRKAIEIEPNSALGWKALGDLLTHRLGRYAEAEEAYLKAIQRAPHLALLWTDLGVVQSEHLERLTDAEQSFRKALELDPTDAWAWIYLGHLLSKLQQRQDEAEAAYRQALGLESGHWALAPLADLLTEQLDRHEEAEQLYRQAASHPQAPESATTSLAFFLLQRGRETEAINVFQDACQRNPNFGNSAGLAWLLQRSGEILESSQWMTRACTFIPDDPSPAVAFTLLVYYDELLRQDQGLVASVIEQCQSNPVCRPMFAALRAANQHDRESLMRINPEERELALQIYDFFVYFSQRAQEHRARIQANKAAKKRSS